MIVRPAMRINKIVRNLLLIYYDKTVKYWLNEQFVGIRNSAHRKS